MRVGNRFALVTSRFDEQSAELVASLLNVSSPEEETEERRVRLDSAQVETIVHQLGAGVSLREITADQLTRNAEEDASDLHSRS